MLQGGEGKRKKNVERKKTFFRYVPYLFLKSNVKFLYFILLFTETYEDDFLTNSEVFVTKSRQTLR